MSLNLYSFHYNNATFALDDVCVGGKNGKDCRGIKVVDMRDRKESKTTPWFSVSDQKAKYVAIASIGDIREMLVGQWDDRQLGGMGEGEDNSTLACHI